MKPHALLLTLVLSGLPTAPAARANLPVLNLKAGQTAAVKGAQITLLSFTDSRCPPRALCLMAGNVTARVLVRKGRAPRLYTVFLPGQAAGTPAGSLRLTAATRAETRQHQQVLTFALN